VDNHILEHIPLYLDDELQEAERLAVEAHIKGCPDCRAALEAERDLVSAIRDAQPAYRTPDSLRESVVKLVGRRIDVRARLQSGRARASFLCRVPSRRAGVQRTAIVSKKAISNGRTAAQKRLILLFTFAAI